MLSSTVRKLKEKKVKEMLCMRKVIKSISSPQELCKALFYVNISSIINISKEVRRGLDF